MLDKKFFNKLSIEVVKEYRKRIFDPVGGGKNAKDVYGKSYPQYADPDYAKTKKKFKGSTAPVLRGDLMNAFQVSQATDRGFGFGAITQRGKIKKLADMRKPRVVSANEKPIPDEVAEFIMDEFDKDTKGAFKKIRRKMKRKKINIKV